MAYQYILYEKKERIATVTLNRPEKLNALNVPLQEELMAAVKTAALDGEVKVIILKGAGRAFCVGYDVAPSTPGRPDTATIMEDLERLRQVDERWLTLRDTPKPVIAQIHGYCLAGGSQLAAMCDLVFVADDARIGSIQAPLGAGFVASMWVWLVGPRKAKEIFYPIGTTIDGKEAERIGWANRSVPPEQLEDAVKAYALKVAETPLEILKLYKIQINRIEDIMGYRAGVMSACEVDAIAHYGPAVQSFYALAREKGLKQALEEWRKHIF